GGYHLCGNAAWHRQSSFGDRVRIFGWHSDHVCSERQGAVRYGGRGRLRRRGLGGTQCRLRYLDDYCLHRGEVAAALYTGTSLHGIRGIPDHPRRGFAAAAARRLLTAEHDGAVSEALYLRAPL